MDKNRQMAHRIAELAAREGGRVYYVGGCVRDAVRGCESKDVDIEVHGIAPELLSQILNSLGRCMTMGASFGIFALKGYDIDIAMPRREHDSADVDPFIGAEKAAMRRDFTMNALMQDVLTGEILDFFGGRDDLRTGIIRHVNDETFAEDPLRVLRAAQFSARFGFEIAQETRMLAASLSLEDITRERIYEEFKKAMLRSEKPSVFFESLRDMNGLTPWFAELTPTVWDEAMRMLDSAAALRDQAKQPMAFLLSALLYPVENDGMSAFVERLTNEVQLIRYCENMYVFRRLPNRMADAEAARTMCAELFDKSICPEDLLLLARAARIANGTDTQGAESFLRTRLSEYRALTAQPPVTGADLMAMGIPSGPRMGKILRQAHHMQLEGLSKAEILERISSEIQ